MYDNLELLVKSLSAERALSLLNASCYVELDDSLGHGIKEGRGKWNYDDEE